LPGCMQDDYYSREDLCVVVTQHTGLEEGEKFS